MRTRAFESARALGRLATQQERRGQHADAAVTWARLARVHADRSVLAAAISVSLAVLAILLEAIG